MKIKLGELRTLVREALAETYDDWKTATPPEYETMGQEPCPESCPPEAMCPYCNGNDPNSEPPDEDLRGNRFGYRGGER